jgi:hypothetical protein
MRLNAYRKILPGSRVVVYCSKGDYRDWRYKSATVVKRYGNLEDAINKDLRLGPYEDLVDVEFDDRKGHVSKGHFTYGIIPL